MIWLDKILRGYNRITSIEDVGSSNSLAPDFKAIDEFNQRNKNALQKTDSPTLVSFPEPTSTKVKSRNYNLYPT